MWLTCYKKRNSNYFLNIVTGLILPISCKSFTFNSICSSPSVLIPSKRTNFFSISINGRNPTFTSLHSNSDIPTFKTELVQNDGDDAEDYEWMTDKERSRRAREQRWKPAEADPSDFYGNNNGISETATNNNVNDEENLSSPASEQKKRQFYTNEEEELIDLMGGKSMDAPSPLREQGFLGDCTLKEISLDYQVPICYLADVLVGWGVPPPIDPNILLGDMVTGEQAFAILEAIHTLDVGALNDRYSNFDLMGLCNEYEIELKDAFELAVKEGWNLPFGVRTFLRVEQEEELIQKFASDMW